ncbi:MAG: hypothetical protein GTN84_15715 [Hydrogenophaga sp.]|uniref:hypothetical protein n=1 Tax=Hydrogenophaga sp. TaxID=1904254 RepID=UPI0016B42C1E|nr:hypothetical protein [Hydrogenophaga sp.]NIM42826.1 hypothetical protein [Hydrogenophaga sp.]NIN27759.1 hypothetical protein [Hydrogenophaga sp.]NIN32578.1 hypothetical protein [Hydrogenophaga sp.]NIN57032.1 hypothetical protein [Hydrogenophaga sp.]NIO53443.1 hypothetical protein [Hydrogenophaga sp.]
MNTAIACTLGPDDLKARLDRIATLARQHLLAERQEGRSLQLLYASAAAQDLEEIVALEQQCCAFLVFELEERANVVELTITAPADAGEFAGFLFEHFRSSAVTAAAPRCGSACGCQSARSATL